MNDDLDAARLTDRVAGLVEAARNAGADDADAVAVRGRSTGVSVRLGKVESTESSEGDDVSLRVFVGRRVASVSANAGSDPRTLAERAVAMAKVSPEDPYQGLANPDLLAMTVRELDLYDPTVVTADALRESALAAEEAQDSSESPESEDSADSPSAAPSPSSPSAAAIGSPSSPTRAVSSSISGSSGTSVGTVTVAMIVSSGSSRNSTPSGALISDR